ncbi:MAG: hypothetical protein K9M11_01315 [Candidatus Pacebacteria bacterium]|nr:hypothetical protein [Candidatus Paceibacterota bacterium]
MNELVLFGVTGDLAKLKLIPALYNLYSTRKIDKKSSFIGFGRRNFSKIEFQAFIEDVLVSYFSKIESVSKKHKSAKKNSTSDDESYTAHKNQIRNFSAQWSYVESELDDISGYKKLASLLEASNTVIYVSLPPMYQYQVAHLLLSSGVIKKAPDLIKSVKISNRKLALEKPYGSNTASSEKLDAFLTHKLHESQILRVDHYAGKQALVEIEAVASQGIFKHILCNQTISKIEVQLNESIDVSNRGIFYDSVGALSDIGQNHILHMLATTLAIPEMSYCTTTNKQFTLAQLRGEALSLLEIPKQQKYKPILGQYDSFTKTQGVKEDSTTETFFRIFANLKKSTSIISKRWSDVSIELVGGKALKEAGASIKLHPVCSPKKSGKASKSVKTNLLAEPIEILVNGYGERDAYEQIFMDAFNYNPNRFIDFRQIKSGWAFIEKVKRISKISKKNKPIIYKKGSYPQDIF